VSVHPPAIAQVTYHHRNGDPPLVEYDSIEAWIRALPPLAVFEVKFERGGTAAVTVGTIIEGGRIEAIAERIRIQARLAQFDRH
jgi:hypothetical protein